MSLSLHQFYFDAIAKCRAHNIAHAPVNQWRYGQAMFNHLVDVRPDLSEAVRGTDADPFHCESPADPRFDRFVAYIETNWVRTCAFQPTPRFSCSLKEGHDGDHVCGSLAWPRRA